MLLNPGSSSGRSSSQNLLVVFLVLFSFALSLLIAKLPYLTSSLIVVGIAVFIACFVNTRFGLYLLIFSMLLSPEFGAGGLGGASASTASRGVTIRLEDILLLILGFAWLIHMAVHKELGLIRESSLNGPIGYYIATFIITTLIGYMAGYVADGKTGFFFALKYIEYFVVYFVIVNNIQSRSHILQFTVALLLTAFIVSVVATAQIPSGGRVSAPFEGETQEPNTLGGYLLLLGSVATGLLLYTREWRVKILLALLIVVMFIPFIFTESRGSWLGLPFAYLTFVIFDRKRRYLMIVLMILAGTLGWEVMPSVAKDRIMYTFTQTKQRGQENIGGATLDTSTSARLNSYKDAIDDFQASPLWGFGVTGYGFLDAQYPRILVETGLMGAVTFGIMILTVFKEARNVLQRTRDGLYWGLAMGLIAGLVGLLVHGLGANTFIIVRIMEPFWLVVGLVVGAAKLEDEQAKSAEAVAGRVDG